MHEVTIRDYIGQEEELTAAQVRQLPEGAKVMIHHFDRYGEHCTLDATVREYTDDNGHVKKYLSYCDFYGPGKKQIRKENNRMCYTICKD